MSDSAPVLLGADGHETLQVFLGWTSRQDPAAKVEEVASLLLDEVDRVVQHRLVFRVGRLTHRRERALDQL